MPKSRIRAKHPDGPCCPKCGSGQVQYRRKDNKRWCRICTHEGPAETFMPAKTAAA